MPPIPIGEDSWVAYAEEASRTATNNAARANVLNIFDDAIRSEPTSLRVWIAYCEYYWTLYAACVSGPIPGWNKDDQIHGRELFSLNDALSLWNRGYDAIKYRIGDSNTFWDRWISLELEQLARTRTVEGVRRITHLFRNRLQTPHSTWDQTSSMFSTFLSEYTKAAWEEQMADITRAAQEAKALSQARDPFELKLSQAQRSGNSDSVRVIMKEYLGWEIAHCRKDHRQQSVSVDICLDLFGRALSGIFATDETIWNDYLVFLSTLESESKVPRERAPSRLEASRRAVVHCPWSGDLWARYMLTGEEAGLDFSQMEKTKHEATTSQLGRDGMAGVVEMYSAWCGYLKRKAMHPHATDEDVELADAGLPSAIEDVQTWGHRLYKDDYQGDPGFRLERIYIQYLTDKDGAIEEARKVWNELAQRELYAGSYNFWLHYHMWEMLVFASSSRTRSPTPSGVNPPTVVRVPSFATMVLQRAVTRHQIDWPERVMEVYLQHCNDYETPDAVRKAADLVHRIQKRVAKRREAEQVEQLQAQQAWQAQQLERMSRSSQEHDSPSGGSKRKRDASPAATQVGAKRPRNEENPLKKEVQQQDQQPKRDREHTSVLVTGLPVHVTQTLVKKFFSEYGHIKNLTVKPEKDQQSAVALIEFRAIEEARSALMRRYFDRNPICVSPASDLTLFVTNFPPYADDKFIHEIFKNCGDIFSIRWPSLKYNTHRRFCYVSFRDPAASAKATQLHGKMLDGRYRLEAKYSDPGNKKAREGAVAEGREVHITSIDEDYSESDIRDVFSKYGRVDSVKILHNKEGKSRGSGFVVFEAKEQAEAAVKALDKTKVGWSILNVEISVHKNYKPVSKTVRARTGTPSGNAAETEELVEIGESGEASNSRGEARRNHTFALMGLPDTVNDARVRDLVDEYGKVVKLILRHDRGGAIVEFADAITAGKASLALEGREYEGQTLRTGPVRDLFKNKAQVYQNTKQAQGKGQEDRKLMPPPPPVRRPVLALGKGNSKRTLGYAAATSRKEEPLAGGVDGAGTGILKSNADFKAMFLNSGVATNGKRVEKGSH